MDSIDSFIPSLPYGAVPQAAVQDRTEQQQSSWQKERSCGLGPLPGTDSAQGQSEERIRPLSLPEAVHRLTLAEPNAALYGPVCAATTVATKSGAPTCATFDRRTLKTALYNLATDHLSRADFIVLANRYGYHAALHNFPLHTLKPSDWLALKERACRQILLHDGSFLAQLAPEIITCTLCMSAYTSSRSKMFKLVPAHLRSSFFTALIKRHPSAYLNLAPAEQTIDRRLQACCADSWVLLHLPCGQRTAELLVEVCRATGRGLEYLAPAARSYELCFKACAVDGRALEHVPDDHKDEMLCQAALSTYTLAYRWLPEALSKSDEWRLLACQKNGDILHWIPKEEHDDTLRVAACRSSGRALAFIDKYKITSEMCRLACRNDVNTACQHIPKRLLDEPMRWLICSTTGDPVLCQRFKPLNMANFYERLLEDNRKAKLEWIPEQSRTDTHYLRAFENGETALELVPEQQRTAEICMAACRNLGYALQWVPVWHRTTELCQLACDVSCLACEYAIKGALTADWFVDALHSRTDHAAFFLTHAKRLLSAVDFQSFLHRVFLCGYSEQLVMLTSKQVSAAQKEQLIEWMLDLGCWPTSETHTSSDLCEMASPLKFSLQNPEVKHLQITAMKVAAHWTPPRYGAGQLLLAEIKQGISKASVVLPDRREPLFQAQGAPAGGRTLRIEQGKQTFHYKFQREGESLPTLMQEGVIHSVRERHPELFGLLRSKLPGDTCFFKLYLHLLPQGLPQFDDTPTIQKDENGHRYVHVYRYVAQAEYSVYAHVADHSHLDNPYHKGEQGILTACHDIGQFMGMGLVPTSTLPAFHDSHSDRAWTALHTLFSAEYRKVYPGTFGAWNSVATERCDFGYGGFRDVGDFEPFGKIESILNRADAQTSTQVPELEQPLCLLNAVCENLLAAHLIRARLRQQGSDYHYKNREAVQQTQTFIEKTLLSFLKGMYAERMHSDSDSAFLRQRLELDKPAYERWLARTAVETLYWTAKQPDPETPDQPPFGEVSSLYSHADGYALHLNRTGRLDPDLYPNGWLPGGKGAVYPDHFQNHAGRLNLGCYNAVFPLTTLMRGLTRLCTGILTCDHNVVALPSEPSQQ